MMKNITGTRVWAVLAVFGISSLPNHASAMADPVTQPVLSAPPNTNTETDKYGPFNWLDHRSAYGAGVFPEPFLVDDSDQEINEFRIDYLHTEIHRQVTDLVTAEVEKGFGPLTLEIEGPYEHDTSRDIDPVTGQTKRDSEQGIGNISLGARVPFFQYVSDSGAIDTTFGVAIEVGIPTNSPVSKNTEVVPKIFNDTVVGNFTFQSVLGYSILYGSGDEGGIQTFEYGFVFGYTLQHHDLPIPDVSQIIPVAELSGATQLNKDAPGHDVLLADAGFRLNLNSIGPIQPRLGIVYVVPIDQGGRTDVQWGIDTSLVFEF